jgi:hypothetical protein
MKNFESGESLFTSPRVADSAGTTYTHERQKGERTDIPARVALSLRSAVS